MDLPQSRADVLVTYELDHDQTCEAFHGAAALPRWQGLGDVLYGRPGWHFVVGVTDHGPGPLWCFGLEGAATLVLTATDQGFHVFDYDDDESFVLADRQTLVDWLHEHEPRHEGLTALQVELRADLRRRHEEALGDG
jgi:hypothetical protein